MPTERFTKSEFREALPDNAEELGFIKGEWVYFIPTAPASRLSIRSTIGQDGFAAETGGDSIRIIVEVLMEQPRTLSNPDAEPKWIAISKAKDAWTTREPGWENRMNEKISPLMRSKMNVPVPYYCNCSGKQHRLYANKTSPNNTKGNADRIFVSNRENTCRYFKFGDTFPIPASDVVLDDSPPWDTGEEKKKEETADFDALFDEEGEEQENGPGMNGKKEIVPAKVFDWSDEQNLCITQSWDEKYIISAAPGSGKTAVMVARIVYLIKTGVDPDRIYAVTFGKPAATEIADRVVQQMPELAGSKLVRNNISTIHAFCYRLLRKWGLHAGPIPDNEAWKLVKEVEKITARHYIGRKKPPANEVMSAIATAKFHLFTAGHDAEFFSKVHGSEHGERLSRCRLEIEAFLRDNNWITFPDMIYLFELALIDDPGRVKEVQNLFDILMIDESQDTAKSAFRILATAAGENMIAYNGFFGIDEQKKQTKKGFVLIGDTDQYLYKWAGAYPEILMGDAEKWFDMKVLFLTKNYRSCPEIVRAGVTSIGNNYTDKGGPIPQHLFKQTTAHRTDRGGVYHGHFDSPSHEAAELTKFVKRIIDAGGAPDDFFFMARTRAYLLQMHAALMSADIPVINLVGGSFWDLKHIKAFVNYIRVANEPGNPWAFMSIVQIPHKDFYVKDFDTGEMVYRGFRFFGSPKKFTEIWKTYGELERDYNELPHDEMMLKISGMKFNMSEWAQDQIYDAIGDMILTVGNLQQRKHDPAALVEYLIENVMEEFILFKDGESGDAEGSKIEDLWNIGGLYMAKGFEDFAKFVSRARSEEKKKKKGDWTGHVILSTIHRMKGREREVSVLVGVSEGFDALGRNASLLPHKFSIDGPPDTGVLNVSPESDVTDELCLFYVGFTRAKRFAVLSSVAAYNNAQMFPSRFIEQLGDDVIGIGQETQLLGVA